MICSKGNISAHMPHAKHERANPPGVFCLFFTAAVKLAGLSLAGKYVCLQSPLNNACGRTFVQTVMYYIMDVYKAV